jgi:hypothetical protein
MVVSSSPVYIDVVLYRSRIIMAHHVLLASSTAVQEYVGNIWNAIF